MVAHFLVASFLLGSSLVPSLVSAQEDFSSFHYQGSPAEPRFDPSYDFCVVGGEYHSYMQPLLPLTDFDIRRHRRHGPGQPFDRERQA